MNRWTAVVLSLALVVAGAVVAPGGRAADGQPETAEKPKVAIFPLAGDADEDLRAKCGFSLRSKLDRDGAYEVIDGYTMADLAESAEGPVTLETGADAIKKLGAEEKATVLIWGELKNEDEGATMRLKVLDLREPEPQVREITKVIKEATDLRFVSEEILESLPGVKEFAHPSEVAVTNDAKAEELWKTNPNLVANHDFSEAGRWQAIYQAEKYAVEVSDALPAVDKVTIFRMPVVKRGDDAEADKAGGTPGERDETNNVLAMNLSQYCAENNGMACLSEKFAIEADTRYRISFKYKSDGPVLHVFVKGYTTAEDIKGKPTEREIYRRQVPPSGATAGEWVTVVDDLNPQHVAFPVQYLKVNLYAYLSPGVVMFDDVVVKAVGEQTRDAKDKALDKPVERPKAKAEQPESPGKAAKKKKTSKKRR